MKILHCITSLDTGGAERTLVRLVNKSNDNHLILTIKNSHKLRKLLDKKIQIISIFPITFKKFSFLYKSIKIFNPDIIQGWMYHGDLIASFIGIVFFKPIFWNIRHGKMSFQHSKKLTFFIRFLLSIFSYLLPYKIISCSYCGVEVHKKVGYCKKKFCIIHNGINIEEKSFKKYSKLSHKKPIKIGSIGRNSPQKNRSYFLHIIESISKSKLIEAKIIGIGIDSSSKLQSIQKRSNYKLILNDSISSIEKAFADLDILLLTSVYGEGCPNIIIEAMQFGLLVISTDVGDSKYILNNNRLIISSNDFQKATEKILNLLNSNDLEEIVSNCQARAKSFFDEDTMVRKYEDAWRSIL